MSDYLALSLPLSLFFSFIFPFFLSCCTSVRLSRHVGCNCCGPGDDGMVKVEKGERERQSPPEQKCTSQHISGNHTAMAWLALSHSLARFFSFCSSLSCFSPCKETTYRKISHRLWHCQRRWPYLYFILKPDATYHHIPFHKQCMAWRGQEVV